MKIVGLVTLHFICIYFLRLLWKDRQDANTRGRAFTKIGLVTKRKSPRLFRFSIWVDFIILLVLYSLVVAYTVWLIVQ